MQVGCVARVWHRVPHLAHAARAMPEYVPLANSTTTPGVMFVAHIALSRYVKVLPQRVPCAIGAVKSMPMHPPFTVVNMHGPFTGKERHQLDAWLDELSHICLLMGDFIDTI